MNPFKFDYQPYLDQLIALIKLFESEKEVSQKRYLKLIKTYTKPDGQVFSKDELIYAYSQLAGTHGLAPFSQEFVNKIKMKPTRTVSGVTPVTVLTKPFPCPGKCIFCPSDVRMPKSYLSDEPGAQRAERNWFDPYLQVYNRLQALTNIGHHVDKVELIILGGTWSFYPEKYQIWFIKECFRALNEFGVKDGRDEVLAVYQKLAQKLDRSDQPLENEEKLASFDKQIVTDRKDYNQVINQAYVGPEKKVGLSDYQTASWVELEKEHQINELAGSRSVGLVIETRPDQISEDEVIRVRRLGCTKTQIGVQSLNDEVLHKNHRGHDVAATRRAFALLRRAGFKIHAHWMANLHGSSVEGDKQDFVKLFEEEDFHPDELKVYPCSLIKSAELMDYYDRGDWQPYFHDELLDVVSFAIASTPEYCRLTRVVRDIPSPDIVVGNKKTNFRQIAEDELKKAGERSVDIRAREIRGQKFDPQKIKFKVKKYESSVSKELFLQYVVPVVEGEEVREKLLAFLRLSLPHENSFIKELKDSAMIREIHVYGPAVNIGQEAGEKAQHLGLGTKLIAQAKKLASEASYKKLAVISAIGTREYYRKKGFDDGELYQLMNLD